MSSDRSYPSVAPRRRWPQVLLIGLVVLAGSILVYRSLLRSRVDKEMALFRQEGIPFTLAELETWQGTIPDKENAALSILEATENVFVPNDAFSRVAWARNDELGQDERDELKSIVTNNAAALEMVHAAAGLRQSRFPIDYSRGPETLLPHLAKIKSLAQILKADAVVSADEGKLDRAVRSIVESLALARSLEREPILISQLVRIACLGIASSTTERLLTQESLSDAQLSALQTAFREASDTLQPAFRTGLFGEVGMGVFAFTSSPARLAQLLDNGGMGQTPSSVVAQLPIHIYRWSGLRDRDFLFYLKMMHQMLDAAKAPFPAGLDQSREAGQRIERGLGADKLLIFSKMLLPALQKSMDKAADAEGRLRCTHTALAVERYRLRQKALPDSLARLVPDFLPSVPIDPADGQPLRYRTKTPGYLVYSIGPDGSDDQGTERGQGGGSTVRKWPPGRGGEAGSKKKLAAPTSNNKAFDVTFVVDR